MDEKQSLKFVKRLYIVEITLFIASAVINVLVLNNILQIKLSELMFSVFLIIIVILSRIREKHENTKKTKNIFMLTTLAAIIWSLTYMFVIFCR